MLIRSAEFVKSAVKPDQFPPATLPEVAFAGRSNVGKSSLINTLVNRKRLVKTSSTPGRTQLINFFCINAAVSFVDLPGYGYAKVPAQVRANWRPMVERYLAGRPNLRGVVLIMDLRREPEARETELLAWLRGRGIDGLLVLTKADKLTRMHRNRQRDKAAKALGVDPQGLILFSARSRLGKDALWQALAPWLTPLDTE